MKNNRIGEISYNKNNSQMTIIEYKSFKEVIVKFQNGYVTKCQYFDFKKGSVKNPLDKSFYNIGYLGIGKYKSTEKINNKKQNTKHYSYWVDMLKRCYSKKYKNIQPTYQNCEVCEEWRDFQNFAKWYDDNYYKINGERTHLDKDILFKTNKVYSPYTSIFVPQRINELFVKNNANRGNYPIGVSYNRSRNKFESKCQIKINKKLKTIHLGRFLTSKEAFNSYKKFKEKYIKKVAEEYKERIPEKLYKAMYEYNVEIND